MEKSTVKERLKAAVNKLYKDDHHLFVVNANERSITFRLGLYLQESFPESTVDCEYNRKEKISKSITLDGSDRRVFPDIIIHKRGNNEQNLLAIEAKSSKGNSKRVQEKRQRDQKKLLRYKQELEYAYGVFIELPASGEYTIEWM